MEKQVRFIPVADKELLRAYGVFYTPGTLRNWHSKGKYPFLFKKFANRLFIDVQALERLIETEGKCKVNV